MAPVPLGLLGGGAGSSPGGRGVDKSSGAPIWRGPGAGASETGGGGSVAAVLEPSGRGDPGAFGLAAGSKASPRRPAAGGGVSSGGGACDVTTDEPPGGGGCEYG